MTDPAQSVPKARATPVNAEAAASPASSAPRDAGDSAAGAQTQHQGQAHTEQRSKFETFELATILSHFDIGVIRTIHAYPRGSRKAPKLIISTDNGTYLLKRRAQGKNDAYRVAFSHGLQLHLSQHQFPLPHLMGTKHENNSMLQWNQHIYELFEYIKGTGYDQSLEATEDAGKILALFHKLLADYESEYEPARGTYHAAKSVTQALNQAPSTLRNRYPQKESQEQIGRLTQGLHAAYNHAVEQAEATGLRDWPTQIVHSDWHPGNMLFRGSRVVAVIDYDSARRYQRIIDIANGALQFSIVAKGDDPETWPDYVDESRFKRFLRGYDSVPDCMLSRAELRAMPWLMIEALVAESAVPVATTGSFSRMDGLAFLKMVERKSAWLKRHANDLIAMADA